MKEQEILDYYNDNWNDYDKIVDMLHKIIDSHEEQLTLMKKQLDLEKDDTTQNLEIEEVKRLLQNCQDNLDEERHK